MLKRNATFVVFLRSALDIFAAGLSWLAVYVLRFHSGLFPTTKGIPDFTKHLELTIPVMAVTCLVCNWTGLYRPKRLLASPAIFLSTLRATLFSGLLLIAALYYLQNEPYSRLLFVFYIIVLTMALLATHYISMEILRIMRKRGYNIRHFAIIGCGKMGQQLLRDIRQMPWMGLKCSFFVDTAIRDKERDIEGVPVLGTVNELAGLVKNYNIDEVYLAVSAKKAASVYPMLEQLQLSGITVRIVPDWGKLTLMSNPTVVNIGTQVLFSAADSGLGGINIVLKEMTDRILSSLALLLLLPLMLIIAVLIKLTSRGPVFFKQKRIGMDQSEFEILKFRTMQWQPENSKPCWTISDDPRVTTIGKFLRKSSLDELPQLINVLKGDMSLVGPRPEQSEFVIVFSEEYKKYMLRHKVKSGMTGWAQINGFRGDSSLRKRLQYDLYYIRNWSIWLDFWILLATPFSVLRGKNAY